MKKEEISSILEVFGKFSISGKMNIMADSDVGTSLTEKELESWMEIEDNRDVQEAVVEDALLKKDENERTTDALTVSVAGAQSTLVHDLDSKESNVEGVETIPSASFVMDVFGRLKALYYRASRVPVIVRRQVFLTEMLHKAN